MSRPFFIDQTIHRASPPTLLRISKEVEALQTRHANAHRVLYRKHISSCGVGLTRRAMTGIKYVAMHSILNWHYRQV
jgi:hypothetical protein